MVNSYQICCNRNPEIKNYINPKSLEKLQKIYEKLQAAN